MEEIRDLVKFSYASSIAGKEITYGENIESLICNPDARDQISTEIIRDYIEQFDLEKSFFWTVGVDEVPLFDKLILFLEMIIAEREN